MESRDLGKGMHEDLVLKLVGGFHMGYINIIMKHEDFTERQTRKCLTRCHVIDKKQSDFTIYVQIYSLLGGSITRKSLEYKTKKRNQLCHHSLALLKSNMKDKVFEKE